MLIVALVEAYWKQFWKVRQSTSWKTAAAAENLQSTKHSSKCTFTPLGATVPDVKTNHLSSNFSLGGTMSTGMTVSFKSIVFWKISETHLEESKFNPPPCMMVESQHEGGGGFISFDRLWWAKSQPTFLCCNPTDRHFSLTGLALLETTDFNLQGHRPMSKSDCTGSDLIYPSPFI